MKIKIFTANFVGLVAACAIAPSVLADAPCDKGFRDTTAAEREKMTAVLQAAKSALPAPSAGWIISGDDAISVPPSLCQDFALVPMDYGFTRYYRQVGDAEERQKKFALQANREAAVYAQKQPRIDALMAQMEKLAAQQGALAGKGDFAGAQRLNPQMEKLQAELTKVMDEGSDPAAMNAAGKEMNRDLEMSIAVRVNAWTERAGPGAKPVPPPSGAQSAFQWHVEDEGHSNDYGLYLFGAWRPHPRGGWRTGTRTGVSLFAAHTVAITVISDPDRLTKTVGAIDFGKVAALVK